MNWLLRINFIKQPTIFAFQSSLLWLLWMEYDTLSEQINPKTHFIQRRFVKYLFFLFFIFGHFIYRFRDWFFSRASVTKTIPFSKKLMDILTISWKDYEMIIGCIYIQYNFMNLYTNLQNYQTSSSGKWYENVEMYLLSI